MIIAIPTQNAEPWKDYRSKEVSDGSGIILYLRALQGHSGRNPTDPSLQDKVIIQSNFFQYIYHIGRAINLHSIMNSVLIPGSQTFEQTTDSILSACGSSGQQSQGS